MIIPENYDLVIYQGADYRIVMTVDLDLTGCLLRMQGRESMAATTTVFSLSTATTGIAITPGSTTTIDVTIPAATTATYASNTEGVWDLEIVWGSGAVDRLVGGRFSVVPEVTR